jgi:hypothetical protein
VSKNDRIQIAAFDLSRAPVFCTFLLAALKKTAVDQDARVFRDYLISRSGHVTGSTKKSNLHNVS